jgi:hypothetical protein
MNKIILLSLVISIMGLAMMFSLNYNPAPELEPVEDRVYLYTGKTPDGEIKCIPGYPTLTKEGHDRMNAFLEYIGYPEYMSLRCP